MTFEFKPKRYDDGSGSDYWFSGIYKISKFDEIVTGPYRRRAFYRAYFKPKSWTMWGQSVDRTVTPDVGYATLEEAQEACRKHAERFPHPSENDRF